MGLGDMYQAQIDAEDGARWRFFVEHHNSYLHGKPLWLWVKEEGIYKHGSMSDAIDYAIALHAKRKPRRADQPSAVPAGPQNDAQKRER